MNAPERTPALMPGAVNTDAQWLAAHWMPYTGNRQFKADPRLIVGAEGAYYTTHDGRRVFDGLSGLWCCGLGHGRREIVQAVARQVAQLDYSPGFQFGHPLSFELANRIVERMPAGLNRVFFTGSGSEAADTSLKMARAYWRTRGQAGKTRLIGRVKGYHGVNFGGISVGGIVANRKLYGQAIDADHLPHTQPAAGSFIRGMPQTGAELADELLNLIALHDASNIAAVIVEPMAGFGRMGAWTGAEAFGVTPDILNFAKQVTNGVQPLGGVVVRQEIYDTFMAAGGPEYMLEFPHGYTYSAHPVVCAAGVAGVDLLASENAIERVRALAPKFEAAVHGLEGAKHVADIRNFGLAAGITVSAAPGEPARRPFEIALAMYRKGFYVRYGGDTIQLAPPFITTPTEIDRLVGALGDTFNATT